MSYDFPFTESNYWRIVLNLSPLPTTTMGKAVAEEQALWGREGAVHRQWGGSKGSSSLTPVPCTRIPLFHMASFIYAYLFDNTNFALGILSTTCPPSACPSAIHSPMPATPGTWSLPSA